MAEAMGFDAIAAEQVTIAASELASNLIKHAGCGTLRLTMLQANGRSGIQIESVDCGPGMPNHEEAIRDGFSTGGGLGFGLGAINRLMDDLEILPKDGEGGGTRILCRKWLRLPTQRAPFCPLDFGAATRRHPGMDVNGDSFVIRSWEESALVAVIDGLGHGPLAHRAAEEARQWIESHFDQPLEAIFRGVARACSASRGVVMALARFDWRQARLTFASIGNVEARVFGNREPLQLAVRRGIVGLRAPRPVVTEHHWEADWVMVLHSDGLRSHWRWEDFREFHSAPAARVATELLNALARDTDDACVVVVKNAGFDGTET